MSGHSHHSDEMGGRRPDFDESELPAHHGHDEFVKLHEEPGVAAELGFYADSRRARRQRQPARGARRFLVLLVALGLIGGAGYLGYSMLKPLLSRSIEAADYPGPGGETVIFTVADGDTGRAIGAKLEKAGIVKTAGAFVDLASVDPRAAGIQPGDYALRQQMTAADALAVLVDPKNRRTQRVTIREGLWAAEVFALLSKTTGRPVADYEAAAKNAAAIGLPADALNNVEGYLFPATYEFTAKDDATAQLRAMVGKARTELTKLGIDPENAQRIVVIASIVEAEARLAEDRPKVARVVLNRLAKPMRLQLDSTVSYGAKKRAITTTDAERAAVNAWNTYQRDGLPAGPISNPGVASLRAAANPVAGPWLFFVAVNPETGETKYATTLAEHNQLVAEFQAWCNKPENQGKCTR